LRRPRRTRTWLRWMKLWTVYPNSMPRKGKVIELRFFGGLSVEETARVLNVSPFTVIRDWNFAKAWLHRKIRSAHEPQS